MHLRCVPAGRSCRPCRRLRCPARADAVLGPLRGQPVGSAATGRGGSPTGGRECPSATTWTWRRRVHAWVPARSRASVCRDRWLLGGSALTRERGTLDGAAVEFPARFPGSAARVPGGVPVRSHEVGPASVSRHFRGPQGTPTARPARATTSPRTRAKSRNRRRRNDTSTTAGEHRGERQSGPDRRAANGSPPS